MAEGVSFYDLLPPVTDLGTNFDSALSSWLWLVPSSARPVLITALGDLFLEIDSEVHFLNTEEGSLAKVAASRDDWKAKMQERTYVATWFRPSLVQSLLENGVVLRSGEVFSPVVPPVLGGRRDASNFIGSQWRNHLHVLGQVHDQVRRLAPGTKIDRIVFE